MIEGHPELLTERQEQAFKLRKQGLLYREIGLELGVSRQRATQLAYPESNRRQKAAYKKRRRRAEREARP